jgi:hypothetical protein
MQTSSSVYVFTLLAMVQQDSELIDRLDSPTREPKKRNIQSSSEKLDIRPQN